MVLYDIITLLLVGGVSITVLLYFQEGYNYRYNILDAIDNISIANYQYELYIFQKDCSHYINEASLYVKVHLRRGYMLLVRKEVALPPFFQKNIVVWITIYSIGNGFVFYIAIVSRHWFHLRGRWLMCVIDTMVIISSILREHV